MVSMNDLKTMPKAEVIALVGPLFSYTLTKAPTQQREALVDRICEALLADADEARAH